MLFNICRCNHVSHFDGGETTVLMAERVEEVLGRADEKMLTRNDVIQQLNRCYELFRRATDITSSRPSWDEVKRTAGELAGVLAVLEGCTRDEATEWRVVERAVKVLYMLQISIREIRRMTSLTCGRLYRLKDELLTFLVVMYNRGLADNMTLYAVPATDENHSLSVLVHLPRTVSRPQMYHWPYDVVTARAIDAMVRMYGSWPPQVQDLQKLR